MRQETGLTVNDHQLEILCDVCRAGMEHAAATLARLAGQAVLPGPTSLIPIAREQMAEYSAHNPAAGICMMRVPGGNASGGA